MVSTCCITASSIRLPERNLTKMKKKTAIQKFLILRTIANRIRSRSALRDLSDADLVDTSEYC